MSASLQPIAPEGDDRIEHKTAVLNGNTYHYLYGVPKGGKFAETVFLVSMECLLTITRLMDGVSIVYRSVFIGNG